MPKGRRARRRARAERHPLPRRVPALTAPAPEPVEREPGLVEWERRVLARREPEPMPLLSLEPEPDEPDPVATQPLPQELTYPRAVTVEELTGGKDDAALTAELAAKLLQIPQCQHCGGRHARACPRVRRMSFHPTGALAEVEFWPEGRWSDTDIIWPEDLNTDE